MKEQFWLQVGDRVSHVKDPGMIGTVVEIDDNLIESHGVTTCRVLQDSNTESEIFWTNKLVKIPGNKQEYTVEYNITIKETDVGYLEAEKGLSDERLKEIALKKIEEEYSHVEIDKIEIVLIDRAPWIEWRKNEV